MKKYYFLVIISGILLFWGINTQVEAADPPCWRNCSDGHTLCKHECGMRFKDKTTWWNCLALCQDTYNACMSSSGTQKKPAE